MHLERNPTADPKPMSPDTLRTLERVKNGAIIYGTHEEDRGVVYWLKPRPDTEDSIGVLPKTVQQLVDVGVLVFLGAEEAGFVDNPLRVYGSPSQKKYQELRNILSASCLEFCAATSGDEVNRGSIEAALEKWGATIEHYVTTPFDYASCVIATLKDSMAQYRKQRIGFATLREIAETVRVFYEDATMPSHAGLMSSLGSLLDQRIENG